MAPDDLMQWAKALAVLGGVTVGVFAVFSPSYVWFKKQLFGWAGAILCGFGTILIVASLFHNITFIVDAPKLEFRLAELQAQVAETKKLVASTNQELSRVATLARDQASIAQIAKLQRDVEQLSNKISQVASTSDAALVGLRSIDAKIRTMPAIDRSQQQPKPEQAPFINPNLAPAR
jgi:hypothetical protein